MALLAIDVDGLTGDQLHDQVGHTLFGGAAIDQTRDIGMFQLGQDLPFGTKPPGDPGRVVIDTHQLDGHARMVMIVGALGLIHLAHAATADQLDEAVRPQARSDAEVGKDGFGRHATRGAGGAAILA